MKISATVLAAGESSRMGEDNKLLLSIDGVPMIRRVAQTVLSAGFDPVVVVTGFECDQVEAALSGLDIQLAQNDVWASGMAGSIFSGMSLLPDGVAGNLIALGDMPFVSVETLWKLRDAFVFHGGQDIAYPEHHGRQANPVIFPRKHFDEILSSAGDRGCKKVLKRYPDDAVAVPIASDEVVLDCDTEEDYLRLTSEMEKLDVQA